jgi:hypothetical protein
VSVGVWHLLQHPRGYYCAAFCCEETKHYSLSCLIRHNTHTYTTRIQQIHSGSEIHPALYRHGGTYPV